MQTFHLELTVEQWAASLQSTPVKSLLLTQRARTRWCQVSMPLAKLHVSLCTVLIVWAPTPCWTLLSSVVQLHITSKTPLHQENLIRQFQRTLAFKVLSSWTNSGAHAFINLKSLELINGSLPGYLKVLNPLLRFVLTCKKLCNPMPLFSGMYWTKIFVIKTSLLTWTKNSENTGRRCSKGAIHLQEL